MFNLAFVLRALIGTAIGIAIGAAIASAEPRSYAGGGDMLYLDGAPCRATSALWGGGIVDIVDHTDMVIIECKAYGGRTSIMGAVSQLDRYLPSFPGYRGAVGLSCRPAEDIARGLAAVGISIITTKDAEIAMAGAEKPAATDPPEAKLADFMASYIAQEHWDDVLALLPAIKPAKLAAEFKRRIAELGGAV